MTTAFWDTSALAPLCIASQATAAHRRYARTTAVVVWWATLVEARGAIQRCHRGGLLSDGQRAVSLSRLAALSQTWRDIMPTMRVRDLAGEQLERFDLRAADAFQLAAALAWCGERPRHRLFLAADQRLTAAAMAVGFDVVAH